MAFNRAHKHWGEVSRRPAESEQPFGRRTPESHTSMMKEEFAGITAR